ncbi:MAG: bacterioferritin-associated ferredoxin [Hyphomicrobiaceae bacterium]
MIVCSCNVISDSDIERVLIEIFSKPDAPIPTPGLVYRELSKRMNCCTCAPIAVAVIYERLEALEQRGQICRFRSAHIRDKLRLIVNKNSSKQAVLSDEVAACDAHLDARYA